MKTVQDPREEWLVYAHSDRDAEHQKPSQKKSRPDGGPLYWLPAHVREIATGRELDVTLFTAQPTPVQFMDVIALDGPHLMDIFGSRGGGVSALYWFEHAQVVGHMVPSGAAAPLPSVSDLAVDDE